MKIEKHDFYLVKCENTFEDRHRMKITEYTQTKNNYNQDETAH